MQDSQTPSRRRKRRSGEEIRSILADLTQSGMSLLGFARERGIPAATLAFWRKRYLDKSVPLALRSSRTSSRFVEAVAPAPAVMLADRSAHLELVLENGLTLRFSAQSIAPQELQAIVVTLRAC